MLVVKVLRASCAEFDMTGLVFLEWSLAHGYRLSAMLPDPLQHQTVWGVHAKGSLTPWQLLMYCYLATHGKINSAVLQRPRCFHVAVN